MGIAVEPAVTLLVGGVTPWEFRAVRTGGSSADDPDARIPRTGRGLARTADGELKRGLARTRVDSRGLARTRGHAAQATPPPLSGNRHTMVTKVVALATQVTGGSCLT